MTTSNAADGSKITNKRHTQSEECGVYSRIMRNNLVQTGNLLHPDTLRFYPNKKVRYWNLNTSFSFLHNI